jgi:hypothetical protein
MRIGHFCFLPWTSQFSLHSQSVVPLPLFAQVDSHSHFIYGWDVEIMRNWRLTGNPKAVITTYPVPHDRIPGWLKAPPVRGRPGSSCPATDAVWRTKGELRCRHEVGTTLVHFTRESVLTR